MVELRRTHMVFTRFAMLKNGSALLKWFMHIRRQNSPYKSATRGGEAQLDSAIGPWIGRFVKVHGLCSQHLLFPTLPSARFQKRWTKTTWNGCVMILSGLPAWQTRLDSTCCNFITHTATCWQAFSHL